MRRKFLIVIALASVIVIALSYGIRLAGPPSPTMPTPTLEPPIPADNIEIYLRTTETGQGHNFLLSIV